MTNESLATLAAAFREWRRKKRTGIEKVPAELIERARRASLRHGASAVATCIRLPKSYFETPSSISSRVAPSPSYTRIEVSAPVAHRPQPLAEAETPAGVKLRLFAMTPETMGLLSSFCRAAGGGI
jgi:hypothetical protein